MEMAVNFCVLQDAGYCLIRSGAAACQGFCPVELVNVLFMYHTLLHFFSNCCVFISVAYFSRSRWPRRGLRRGSAAACLLGLRVRMPLMAWMSVCFEYFVLSVTGPRDGPIPRPEESYRMCVLATECDQML